MRDTRLSVHRRNHYGFVDRVEAARAILRQHPVDGLAQRPLRILRAIQCFEGIGYPQSPSPDTDAAVKHQRSVGFNGLANACGWGAQGQCHRNQTAH